MRAVDDEPVELDERAFVEQEVEPLARGQLALGVLRLEARVAAALLGFGDPALEQLELVSHGHRREKLCRMSS